MNDITILDILEQKGVELQREGSVIRAFCPFHNDTGRPNFTVYPQTDSWFCFACNIGGDAISFLSKFENISYAAAKTKLVGVTVNFDTLNETLDGLKVPDDEPVLNNEINVLVSKLIRRYAKDNPTKLDKVLQILKDFDSKLLIPINSAKLAPIIKTIQSQLGE